MGNLGIGAMLHILGGGSEHSSDEYIGKQVSKAWMDDAENRLCITFSDGVSIQILDDGQSCCERRYMTTDDDPSSLVGGKWIHAKMKGGPSETEGEWGDVHEQMFVEIATDKGLITIANHNEHNGYYGGFGMSIRNLEAE